MSKKEWEEEFFKKIRWVLPSKPGEGINLHPLFFHRISPVGLMFLCNITGRFFFVHTEGENPGVKPFSIIDAIDENNEIVLKINLNQNRGDIEEVFKKILTLSFAELKKHGRKRVRISKREFDLYNKVYELKEKKGWNFPKIAREMFPRDFNEAVKDGTNRDSAIKKVARFYREAKKLINGQPL